MELDRGIVRSVLSAAIVMLPDPARLPFASVREKLIVASEPFGLAIARPVSSVPATSAYISPEVNAGVAGTPVSLTRMSLLRDAKIAIPEGVSLPESGWIRAYPRIGELARPAVVADKPPRPITRNGTLVTRAAASGPNQEISVKPSAFIETMGSFVV